MTTYPEEEVLYLLRSQCFELQGDPKSAIQACLKVLTIDPENLTAQEVLARLYNNLGKDELG